MNDTDKTTGPSQKEVAADIKRQPWVGPATICISDGDGVIRVFLHGPRSVEDMPTHWQGWPVLWSAGHGYPATVMGGEAHDHSRQAKTTMPSKGYRAGVLRRIIENAEWSLSATRAALDRMKIWELPNGAGVINPEIARLEADIEVLGLAIKTLQSLLIDVEDRMNNANGLISKKAAPE